MDIEVFMYAVMTSLYKMNAPIVFKGALVLKAIQMKYGNPSGLERETHDIDGDWIGQKPSIGYLVNLVQSAVYNAGYPNVKVIAYRDYGDNTSAGFKFMNTTSNNEIVRMDLGLRYNNSLEEYSLVNGVSFCGQSINKVLVDKIVAVSSRKIFRRVKDVIDLYILSYIWSGTSDSIFEYIKTLNTSLESFSEFKTGYESLNHAYSKYINKCRVLPFDIVYKRVYLFLSPIISGKNGLYWNGVDWYSLENTGLL